MERNLVRIGGRSDELGRPYLYTTTKQFLRTFGLENLDGLPRVAAITKDGGQYAELPSEDHASSQGSESTNETDTTQENREESNIPVSMRSDATVNEQQDRALLDQLVAPQLASTFGDDEDDDFYDDDEDLDDDFDDQDDEEGDLEDGWELVEDDDEDWSDDDDSEWGYDDEEDDEDWD